MAKPLIIAEKPSAARAIAEALGGFNRREGYLESSQYLLTWALGHLVELASPEEYDARYKRWSMDYLPILPQFQLRVVPKTRSQYEVIRRLIGQATELINACDAAREGELIFRYITQTAGSRLPARRLWVSSLTKEAIRQGFAALLPEREYDRLYQSALCRSQGDWLVGLNATRAFTVRSGDLLSVGRVQTPTLALLVNREREIRSFVPEEYWEVFAAFGAPAGAYRGKWFGPDGDRLKKAEEAEAIRARCEGKPAAVESVKEQPGFERPPGLYDLTTLQRDANRRFGLTAAATLKAAQELYEGKLISYPRTDSRYLTRDMLGTLPKAVASLEGRYPELVQGARLNLVHPGNRRVVDDSKVTDHHAIIPTGEKAGALSGAPAKIYDLIARRFLAQFYPEMRYLETEVITRVFSPPGDLFRSKGRRVLEPGWQVCDPPAKSKKEKEEDEEGQASLPSLKEGQPVPLTEVEVKQKQTQPPKRYSEATLLSAMETAGKGMEDEALKEAMKGRGLGTPATRAATIERLKDVGYITLEKKVLVPTEKGIGLVEQAEALGAQVLLSAELTGEWEKRIADIQAGQDDPDAFMSDIRALTEQLVALTKAGAPVQGRAARQGATARTSGSRKPRSGATMASATAPPEAQPTTLADLPPVAGTCPRCGRAVIKKSRDWSCLNDDCTLRVPSFLCGKVLDREHVGALLEKGRTPLIANFTSKTGKPFKAYLVLKADKVEFEFPPTPKRRTAGEGYGKEGSGGKTGGKSGAAKTGSRTVGTKSDSRSPK